jgi:hypothetical protein
MSSCGGAVETVRLKQCADGVAGADLAGTRSCGLQGATAGLCFESGYQERGHEWRPGGRLELDGLSVTREWSRVFL